MRSSHQKKLFGTRYDRFNYRKIIRYIFVSDISESGFHLPGERDVVEMQHWIEGRGMNAARDIQSRQNS